MAEGLTSAAVHAEWSAHRPVCEGRHHAAGEGQCIQPVAVGGDDGGAGAGPCPDWQPCLARFAARSPLGRECPASPPWLVALSMAFARSTSSRLAQMFFLRSRYAKRIGGRRLWMQEFC